METKVITGKVRLSYLQVFEARANEEGGVAKFSASLIIPKSDTVTLANIRKAIAAATEVGKSSKFDGKIPTVNFKNPLRDGDLERPDDANYANCYFVNASSTNRPQLVDSNLNPILDRDDLYSGCYGRASVNFFPFNSKGNKGIACGLNSIQKLSDGEPLGSVSRAEVDFAAPYEMDPLLD